MLPDMYHVKEICILHIFPIDAYVHLYPVFIKRDDTARGRSVRKRQQEGLPQHFCGEVDVFPRPATQHVPNYLLAV